MTGTNTSVIISKGATMLAEISLSGLGAGAAIAVPIVGVYVWVASHIANRKRHPNADTIVYQDTCTEVQKRMDEREDRATERHDELKALIISNGKAKG